MTIVPTLSGLTFIKGTPTAFPVPGKACVLEFWATWCPPCRTACPHLTEIAHRHRDITFLGVTQEDERVAAPFVTKMGQQMDYNVALDEEGEAHKLMSSLGGKGIPFAVLIDAHGKVVWTGHPMSPEFEDELQRVTKSIVKDLSGLTEAQLNSEKVADLKKYLAQKGVSISGLLEKQDLVKAILNL